MPKLGLISKKIKQITKFINKSLFQVKYKYFNNKNMVMLYTNIYEIESYF